MYSNRTTEREVNEMKKEVIAEMNNFAIRVLKGEGSAHPQEVAILPEVLHILKALPEDESGRNED